MVSPEEREIVRLIHLGEDIRALRLIRSVFGMDLDAAREALRSARRPDRDLADISAWTDAGSGLERRRSTQASSRFADNAALEYAGFTPGQFWVGRNDSDSAPPIGYLDDRHIMTVAGSRAGKGVTSIIPNLCHYPGSVVCIDPKGENAAVTARRRGEGSNHCLGLGQKVVVLDPFDTSGLPDDTKGCFNPLDCIDLDSPDAIDEAKGIAEALIVSTDSKDAHWDESAKQLLAALVLFVRSEEPAGRQHLLRVRELLTRGDAEGARDLERAERERGNTDPLPNLPFFVLLSRMRQCEGLSYGGVIAAAAETLDQMGAEERGSVLSFARRNTAFLDSPRMAKVLASSSFSLDELKLSPQGLTLYLCLPVKQLATHSRWLRLMVMQAMAVPVPMIAARDIAEVVVREMLSPAGRGVLHLHAPRHYTFREVARILGGTIGLPDLKYVQAEPAQARAAMLQAGFSADAVDRMEEMASWLSASVRTSLPGPVEVTPTTLEQFAPQFRAVFDALPALA